MFRKKLCMPGLPCICSSNLRPWRRECCGTNPRATSILDEAVAGIRNQNVPKPMAFCMVHLITAMSNTHFVRRCLGGLGPCAHLQRFTSHQGRSRRSRAVIVSLSSVLRYQKLYMTCILSLYARCCCGKDIDFASSHGRQCFCTWMRVQYKCYYGLGIDGLIMGGSRT